jgi:hypothetical protein
VLSVDSTAPHMTPEQFRRYRRVVVDRIAEYWEQVESLLANLDRVILPGLTH